MTADPPAFLAFLNFGATEVVLIVILFVVLFGADKIPAAARTLGRVQSEWNKARRDIEREIRTEEEMELERLRDFEAQRERFMREAAAANAPKPTAAPDAAATAGAAAEEADASRVREAARALGIEDADSASVPDLRRRVAERVTGRSDGARGAEP